MEGIQHTEEFNAVQIEATTMTLMTTPKTPRVDVISTWSANKAHGRPIGHKSQLRLTENDKFRKLTMENGASIAVSLRRHTKLVEEKNGMLACAREERENYDNLVNSVEFSKLLRKEHMKCIRARLADEEDCTTVCPRLSVGARGTSNSSSPVDDFLLPTASLTRSTSAVVVACDVMIAIECCYPHSSLCNCA